MLIKAEYRGEIRKFRSTSLEFPTYLQLKDNISHVFPQATNVYLANLSITLWGMTVSHFIAKAIHSDEEFHAATAAVRARGSLQSALLRVTVIDSPPTPHAPASHSVGADSIPSAGPPDDFSPFDHFASAFPRGPHPWPGRHHNAHPLPPLPRRSHAPFGHHVPTHSRYGPGPTHFPPHLHHGPMHTHHGAPFGAHRHRFGRGRRSSHSSHSSQGSPGRSRSRTPTRGDAPGPTYRVPESPPESPLIDLATQFPPWRVAGGPMPASMDVDGDATSSDSDQGAQVTSAPGDGAAAAPAGTSSSAACCHVASSKLEIKDMMASFLTDFNRVISSTFGEEMSDPPIAAAPTASTSTTTTAPSAAPAAEVTLVWCDACGSGIRGVKYCCTECPNYDLCQKCFATVRHPEPPQDFHTFTTDDPLMSASFCVSGFGAPPQATTAAASGISNDARWEVIVASLDDRSGAATAATSSRPARSSVRAPSSVPVSSRSTSSRMGISIGRDKPATSVNLDAAPIVHKGVICDRCQDEIVGDRHKCVDCPDYDLCPSCIETAEDFHPGHRYFTMGAPARVVVHTIDERRPMPVPVPEAPVRTGVAIATLGDEVAHDATCDLCDSRIVGPRYKCLTCPDWDACASCFQIVTEQHPRHAFVRVSQRDGIITQQAASIHSLPRHRATCDECNDPIFGIRFKCIHPSCDDFDLCQTCEALPIPVHPAHHPMVKIRDPATVIPELVRTAPVAAPPIVAAVPVSVPAPATPTVSAVPAVPIVLASPAPPPILPAIPTFPALPTLPLMPNLHSSPMAMGMFNGSPATTMFGSWTPSPMAFPPMPTAFAGPVPPRPTTPPPVVPPKPARFQRFDQRWNPGFSRDPEFQRNVAPVSVSENPFDDAHRTRDDDAASTEPLAHEFFGFEEAHQAAAAGMQTAAADLSVFGLAPSTPEVDSWMNSAGSILKMRRLEEEASARAVEEEQRQFERRLDAMQVARERAEVAQREAFLTAQREYAESLEALQRARQLEAEQHQREAEQHQREAEQHQREMELEEEEQRALETEQFERLIAAQERANEEAAVFQAQFQAEQCERDANEREQRRMHAEAMYDAHCEASMQALEAVCTQGEEQAQPDRSSHASNEYDLAPSMEDDSVLQLSMRLNQERATRRSVHRHHRRSREIRGRQPIADDDQSDINPLLARARHAHRGAMLHGRDLVEEAGRQHAAERQQAQEQDDLDRHEREMWEAQCLAAEHEHEHEAALREAEQNIRRLEEMRERVRHHERARAAEVSMLAERAEQQIRADMERDMEQYDESDRPTGALSKEVKTVLAHRESRGMTQEEVKRLFAPSTKEHEVRLPSPPTTLPDLLVDLLANEEPVAPLRNAVAEQSTKSWFDMLETSKSMLSLGELVARATERAFPAVPATEPAAGPVEALSVPIVDDIPAPASPAQAPAIHVSIPAGQPKSLFLTSPFMRSTQNLLLGATFLSNNNIPDGHIFPPGAEFTKSWRMANDSDTAWPAGTEIVFVAGHRLGAHPAVPMRYPVGEVQPGERVDISAPDMKAPEEAGGYIGYWRLSDGDGNFFGHRVWCDITVEEPERQDSGSSLAASSVIMPQSAPSTMSPPPAPVSVHTAVGYAASVASEPTTPATLTASDGGFEDVDSDSSGSLIERSQSSDSDSDGEWEEGRHSMPAPAPHRLVAEGDVDYIVLYDSASADEA